MNRWLGRVVAAALVWGVVLGYASLSDRSSDPLGLAAAVAAAMTVGWLCVDLSNVAEPPQWSLYHSTSPSRTFDPRFSRLSQELADASDRRTAAAAVHTSVAAIADRILLDKYDVDITMDQAVAHQILGEQITAFLATDPQQQKQVFTPQLSEVLTRLESL